jgi:putative FmdB family regulatory protein
MPLYDYRCVECNKEYSLYIAYTDTKTKPECPHCGGLRYAKKIQKPSVIYKGDGFTKKVGNNESI